MHTPVSSMSQSDHKRSASNMRYQPQQQHPQQYYQPFQPQLMLHNPAAAMMTPQMGQLQRRQISQIPISPAYPQYPATMHAHTHTQAMPYNQNSYQLQRTNSNPNATAMTNYSNNNDNSTYSSDINNNYNNNNSNYNNSNNSGSIAQSVNHKFEKLNDRQKQVLYELYERSTDELGVMSEYFGFDHNERESLKTFIKIILSTKKFGKTETQTQQTSQSDHSDQTSWPASAVTESKDSVYTNSNNNNNNSNNSENTNATIETTRTRDTTDTTDRTDGTTNQGHSDQDGMPFLEGFNQLQSNNSNIGRNTSNISSSVNSVVNDDPSGQFVFKQEHSNFSSNEHYTLNNNNNNYVSTQSSTSSILSNNINNTNNNSNYSSSLTSSRSLSSSQAPTMHFNLNTNDSNSILISNQLFAGRGSGNNNNEKNLNVNNNTTANNNNNNGINYNLQNNCSNNLVIGANAGNSGSAVSAPRAHAPRAPTYCKKVRRTLPGQSFKSFQSFHPPLHSNNPPLRMPSNNNQNNTNTTNSTTNSNNSNNSNNSTHTYTTPNNRNKSIKTKTTKTTKTNTRRNSRHSERLLSQNRPDYVELDDRRIDNLMDEEDEQDSSDSDSSISDVSDESVSVSDSDQDFYTQNDHTSNDTGNTRNNRKNNRKISRKSGHNDEKPFKCPVRGCSNAYKNRKGLGQHYQAHQNQKCPEIPFKCGIDGCPFITDSKISLNIHKGRVHSSASSQRSRAGSRSFRRHSNCIYKCNKCGRTFDTSQGIACHKRHSTRRGTCELVRSNNYSVDRESSFDSHSNINYNHGQLQGSGCQNNGNNMNNSKNTNKRFVCRTCDLILTSEKKLVKHKRIHYH